jgi:hypothetical protein
VRRDIASALNVIRSLDEKNNVRDNAIAAEGDVEPDSERERFLQLALDRQLAQLIDYLRRNYFYCIYCGVQYRDPADLANCPGATREEHD